MTTRSLICAIWSSIAALGGTKLDVSVCNFGQLPEAVVTHAKDEAATVFQSIDIEVVWRGCDEAPPSDNSSHRWLTIRLRNDRSPRTAGPTSLDAMGRAYVSGGTVPYLADAYYGTVRTTADANGTDSGVLLGCVIAHEMGHLLLGPGHVPDGIMRGSWKPADLDALRKRWLKFNREQALRIHNALRPDNSTSRE